MYPICCQHIPALYVYHCMAVLLPVLYVYVDFTVSLDLQWDYCSDQLTLTCTHSEAQTDPSWVYNGTTADGVSLDNIRQSTLNLLQPDMLQLSVEWTM